MSRHWHYALYLHTICLLYWRNGRDDDGDDMTNGDDVAWPWWWPWSSTIDSSIHTTCNICFCLIIVDVVRRLYVRCDIPTPRCTIPLFTRSPILMLPGGGNDLATYGILLLPVVVGDLSWLIVVQTWYRCYLPYDPVVGTATLTCWWTLDTPRYVDYPWWQQLPPLFVGITPAVTLFFPTQPLPLPHYYHVTAPLPDLIIVYL